MSIRQVALAEVAVIKGLVGGPFGSSLVSSDYEQDGVPVIRGTNLGHGKYVGGEFVFVSEEKLRSDLSRNLAIGGDVVFTQRGTLGQVALVPHDGFRRYVVSQSQMRLRAEPALASPEFLFYACSSALFQKQIADNAISTGVPHINLGILGRLTIPLPGIAEQRAITEVQGALDDKIEANTKLLALLDAHMAMEYTASIPPTGKTVRLDDVVDFHNRRRVPLSSRERDERPGDVPYFGASGAFGSVDRAIFNEPLVLVGEDGSVIKDDGTPVVQYIWGPSWVNNHAHVLTGVGISTELLYLAICREQVATLVTGAVQPKINMGNLKRLELHLPESETLQRIETIVRAETASKRALVEENRLLASTRDALLPQLMSGKLRVRDAKKVLEGVL